MLRFISWNSLTKALPSTLDSRTATFFLLLILALKGKTGHFQKEDEGLVMSFRSFIRRINGKLGKIFGSGTVNSDFVSAEEKKELVKLKDEYDYNNILNSGKIISYR